MFQHINKITISKLKIFFERITNAKATQYKFDKNLIALKTLRNVKI